MHLLARSLLSTLAKPEIPPMNINTIPSKKLALLCTAFFAAAMLVFSPNASALDLTFVDTHVVGTVTPGAPADPNKVADYVNFMITQVEQGHSVVHDFGQPQGVQTITRSMNEFPSLPTASGTGAVSGTGTTIDLNALGTFTYLFAKYDGQNDKSLVWNIAGLTGMLRIPQNGPLGKGLSGWILFGPDTPSVPDGGTTVMLLGAALGALGIARRYIMR
jgi:VPDSG-CTERM motif